MTDQERRRMDSLEDAVIDRERRIFSLANLIRGIGSGQDPKQCLVDYGITEEQARVLGIENYARAVEFRQTAG